MPWEEMCRSKIADLRSLLVTILKDECPASEMGIGWVEEQHSSVCTLCLGLVALQYARLNKEWPPFAQTTRVPING